MESGRGILPVRSAGIALEVCNPAVTARTYQSESSANAANEGNRRLSIEPSGS